MSTSQNFNYFHNSEHAVIIIIPISVQKDKFWGGHLVRCDKQNILILKPRQKRLIRPVKIESERSHRPRPGWHSKRAGSLEQTNRTGIYEKGNNILGWVKEKGYTSEKVWNWTNSADWIPFQNSLSLTYLFFIFNVSLFCFAKYILKANHK